MNNRQKQNHEAAEVTTPAFAQGINTDKEKKSQIGSNYANKLESDKAAIEKTPQYTGRAGHNELPATVMETLNSEVLPPEVLTRASLRAELIISAVLPSCCFRPCKTSTHSVPTMEARLPRSYARKVCA